MPRYISPPEKELNNLRQPLTPGEKVVFDFFNEHLPEKWEIYVQPHLNGLRPDFVLLNPSIGIAVFEVKDWNLDAVEYEVKIRRDRSLILLGRKDGKEFSLQKDNPIEKVLLYKKEINELYCPRLDSEAGLAVITAGVIFPFASDDRVQELFQAYRRDGAMKKYPEYFPISGTDSLKSDNIKRVFPEVVRSTSIYMNEVMAKDLRNWLVEPDFAATQRVSIILEMDRRQRELAATRTETGYRRIKGPAGSGKSLVLAARAAQLAAEEKSVLVITFNITLLHYLMDLAVRWSKSGRTRASVTWLNYHYWCKRVCIESGHRDKYNALWRGLVKENSVESDDPDIDAMINYNLLENANLWNESTGDEVADSNDPRIAEILNEQLPRLVLDILQNDVDGSINEYDAVLVDEGQDMHPLWWETLRKVCKPDGEMLLVADATQDVYDTARSWTDEAMTGAGFRGEWAQLEISYRMPPKALQYARTFAETFLPRDNRDLPVAEQSVLDLYPCDLRWVQTSPERAKDVCLEELLAMAPKADPKLLAIADITFLCQNRKVGEKVIGLLNDKKINTIHTFSGDSRKSRRMKMGFFMGDARIKATTLHSFKGWESRAIVCYIDSTMGPRALALIYTGLTRLKRHEQKSFLTVVSSATELAEYGKTWSEYEKK